MAPTEESKARAAREAVAQADHAQRDAAARSREAAAALKNVGLTGRDIAVVLRVSPQRVSQLLGGHRVTGTGSRIAGRVKQRGHTHR
jgi:hypothetical protein